jgi:hypothetical protein
VDPAALPRRAEDLDDGCLQTFMRVRNHQPGAAQAAPRQAAQELDLERFGLAVARDHAEHFASAVGVDANRDNYRNGDNLMVAPDFDKGGVQLNIGPVALDWPGEEHVHALVDLIAHAIDLAFADALHAERLNQVID